VQERKEKKRQRGEREKVVFQILKSENGTEWKKKKNLNKTGGNLFD
jgi:hypothetical protein